MESGGIPLPEEAISQTLMDMVKKKSINLDPDEKDSKKSKRKSDKDKELSAAEKFSNFKKQRFENKREGDIVDDLFKDFIVKKMKEIDAERGRTQGDSKSKSAKSVRDFNKFLDKEIKHINSVQPTASQAGGNQYVIKTEKGDVVAATAKINDEGIVSVKEENEDEPTLPPLHKDGSESELAVSASVKADAKKTTVGFKNFGIKLSLTSTELIKSGDVHIKGKRLEEGNIFYFF